MMMRRMVVVLMGRRSYQKPTHVLGLHPICLPKRRLDSRFCRLAVEVGGSSTITLTAHAKVASTAFT